MSNTESRPNLIPIWTPKDAVDTARQFHLELDNAERRLYISPRLMSQSRERKARRMDGLAVALLMLLMAALGCVVMLLSTPQAKATPQDDAYAYAAVYGPVVCQVLDEYPSNAGIIGIGQALTEDGWDGQSAGRIVAYSAAEFCPRHMPLLKRFAALYGGSVA